MEYLPDELLENVFLRLPLDAVGRAKLVRWGWKRLIESKSFARSYNCKVILASGFGEQQRSYELVHEGATIARWKGTQLFSGGISSHINGFIVGLVFAQEGQVYYVGNILTDKWEEVPLPPRPVVDVDAGEDDTVRFQDDTGIFDMGDGQYKLVFWRDNGEIMTLMKGQTEWTTVRESDNRRYFAHPVAMESSIFRLRCTDGMLMEYNAILGRFSSVLIRSKDSVDLDMDFRGAKLIVWEGKIYSVLECKKDGKVQAVEIWQISPSDGCATYVDKIEIEATHFVTVSQGVVYGLLTILGQEILVNSLQYSFGKISSLNYSLMTNSVQEVTDTSPESSSFVTVAASLDDINNMIHSQSWESVKAH